MTLILIACSFSKAVVKNGAPARELYTGKLTRLGLELAASRQWKPLILSAKYGFVDADEYLETYDQKLARPYAGPWPEGEGYYLGGKLYFGKAPDRFKPLVTGARKYGELVSATMAILGTTDTHIHVQPHAKGVVKTIYDMLTEQRLTQDEVYRRLCTKFGERETMRKTIKAQLRQSRMGKERDCVINCEDGKFWITPNNA